MAACGMWEVWKARNKATYECKEVNWKLKCMRWAQLLARLISKPYIDTMNSALTLSVLKICKPGTQVDSWHHWRPGETGNTMSIGWIRKDERSVGGAVVRSREGSFRMAFKLSCDRSNDFQTLIWFIDKSLDSCAWSDVRSIQGSHPLMIYLQHDDDGSVPMDLVEDRRDFQGRHHVPVYWVIPMRNSTTLALAWGTKQEGRPLRWEELGLAVRRALRGVRKKLGHHIFICPRSHVSFTLSNPKQLRVHVDGVGE